MKEKPNWNGKLSFEKFKWFPRLMNLKYSLKCLPPLFITRSNVHNTPKRICILWTILSCNFHWNISDNERNATWSNWKSLIHLIKNRWLFYFLLFYFILFSFVAFDVQVNKMAIEDEMHDKVNDICEQCDQDWVRWEKKVVNWTRYSKNFEQWQSFYRLLTFCAVFGRRENGEQETVTD